MTLLLLSPYHSLFFFFFLNPTRFNWPKAIIVETSNLQFTPQAHTLASRDLKAT
jgi:hypothetical protein